MGVSWAATRLLTQKDSVDKDTANPIVKGICCISYVYYTGKHAMLFLVEETQNIHCFTMVWLHIIVLDPQT